MEPRFWTDEEVEYLTTNYNKMTYKQIADKLDRTKKSIDIKLQNMKRKNPDFKGKREQSKRHWSKKEIQYVKDNLANMTNTEIALELKRTHASVQTKIVTLCKQQPELKEIIRPRENLDYEDERLFNKRVIDLKECPDCGSRRINQVENVVDGAKYYCVNCMSEYTKYGEKLKPLF